MLKLKKGENATKQPMMIDLKGKKTIVNHIWKPNKDSEVRYQLTFTYDFSKVSDEDVMRYAAQWVNKDYQNRLRLGDVPSDAALAEMEKTPIDVAEMYTRKARVALSPAEQLKKLMGTMSKEEILAYIKAAEAAEAEEK